MSRLAPAVCVYALVASLALVAPLAASDAVPAPPEQSTPAPPVEEPAAEQAPPEPVTEAAPPEPATEAAPPAVPEAAPTEAAPVPAPAPAPEPQQLVGPAAQARPPARVALAAAAAASVTIKDFDFAPGSVTVTVGDTVTWVNNGPTPHTATADDGSFDTGLLSAGESGSQTFDQPGTIAYHCAPHPSMTATIVVQAAAGGDDPASSGEPSGDGTSTGAPSDTGAEIAAGQTGPTLPNTGLDSGGLALLGAATLLLGLYLRRRTGHAPAGPAGRIGW